MPRNDRLRKEGNISPAFVKLLLQFSAPSLGILRITQIAVCSCFGPIRLTLQLFCIGQPFSDLFAFGKSKLFSSVLCTVKIRILCPAHPCLGFATEQIIAPKNTLFVFGHFLILRFFKMQLYLSCLSVQNIFLFHISASPNLRQFDAVQAKNDLAAVAVVISRHGKPCIVGLYI